MHRIQKRDAISKYLILTTFSAIAVMLLVSLAFAHGPKGHTEGFTALQAVKKGAMLYDKLVASGKLDASWEISLKSINVYRRDTGRDEIVVKFNRSEGDPGSVYIFFDDKGDYVGSNFSGE